MGFWSVVAVGIGGMVGGGIFAVLGLSVQLAQGGAPLAFAIAGTVALEYALAAAAKPFMGQAGFSLIAIAALLSTASALNATLYGTSRLSFIIAKSGELPSALEKKIWNQPVEGLLITSGLTLIVANVFDLSGISTMGSSGFLIIFAAVNFANVRLYKRTNSYRWISFLGIVFLFNYFFSKP